MSTSQFNGVLRHLNRAALAHDAAVLTNIHSGKSYGKDGQVIETHTDHRATFIWAQRNGGWVIVYCHDEHGKQPDGVQELRLQGLLELQGVQEKYFEKAVRPKIEPKKP